MGNCSHLGLVGVKSWTFTQQLECLGPNGKWIFTATQELRNTMARCGNGKCAARARCKTNPGKCCSLIEDTNGNFAVVCPRAEEICLCVVVERGQFGHSSLFLTTSSLRFSTDDEAQKRGGKATIRAWMRLWIRTTQPMKLQRRIMVHLIRGSHFWLPTSDTGGSHHVWSGLSPVYPSSITVTHLFKCIFRIIIFYF